MKNRSNNFKQLNLLLAGVLSAFVLSACNGGSTSPSSTSSSTTPSTSGLVALGASANGVNFSYSALANSLIWSSYVSGTSEAIQGIAVNSQSDTAAYAALAGTDSVLVAASRKGQWVSHALPVSSVGQIAYARRAGAFVVPLADNTRIVLVDDSGAVLIKNVVVTGGSTASFAAPLILVRAADDTFVAQDSERNLYQSANGYNWEYLGRAAYIYTDITFYNGRYYGLTGSANAPGKIYYADSPTELALEPAATERAAATAMAVDEVTGKYYVADASGIEVFAADGAANLGDPLETLALPTGVAFTSTNVQQLAIIGDVVYVANSVGGAGKAALTAVPGIARVTGPDRLLISRTIDDMLMFANGSYQIVSNPKLEVAGSLVAVVPGTLETTHKPKVQVLASGADLAVINVQGNVQAGFYAVLNNGAIISKAPGGSLWSANAAILDDTDNTLVTATQLVFSTKNGTAYFMQTNGTAVYISTAAGNDWVKIPDVAFRNASGITISAVDGVYYANTSEGVFRATGNPAEAENWGLMSASEIAVAVGLPPGATPVPSETYNFADVAYQFVPGSTQVNTIYGSEFSPIFGAALIYSFEAAGSNIAYTGNRYVMAEAGGNIFGWAASLPGPATDWVRYTASFSSKYPPAEAGVAFADSARVFYSGAENSFLATAKTAEGNSILVLCNVAVTDETAACNSVVTDSGDGMTMTGVMVPYGANYLAQ